MTPKQFGARLKQLRKDANMTQDQLAEVSGVSQASISDYERGKSEHPEFFMVAKLAKALGVSTDAFLIEAEEEGEPLAALVSV